MNEKALGLRRITSAFLVIFFSVGALWDVYVAHNDVEGDTISEIFRDLSHAWYSIPFVFGIVVGHLFWNQPAEQRKSKEERRRIFFSVVVPATVAVLLRDLANQSVEMPGFDYANLVALVVGFFVGARYWPQGMPQEEEHEVHPPTDP